MGYYMICDIRYIKWVDLIMTSTNNLTIDDGFYEKNHLLFMAEQFRLVNYCNLPQKYVPLRFMLTNLVADFVEFSAVQYLFST